MGEKLLAGDKESNPKGHYEDSELVMLNEVAISRDWTNPRLLDTPIIRQRYTQYVMMRNGKPGNEDWWGVKDPRLCFTFPMLLGSLQMVQCKPFVLLIQRSREMIIRSLEKRNGRKAEGIYERYDEALGRTIAEFTSDYPDSVKTIKFSDLLFRPQREVERIVEVLGIEPREERIGDAVEFIDPSLCHHTEVANVS